MPRTEIEVMRRMLDQAYRTDPWSALRKNIASVRPDEWDVRPAKWSVDEFGTDPWCHSDSGQFQPQLALDIGLAPVSNS